MYTLEIRKKDTTSGHFIRERTTHSSYYVAFRTAKMEVRYNEQVIATISDSENKVIACFSNTIVGEK